MLGALPVGDRFQAGPLLKSLGPRRAFFRGPMGNRDLEASHRRKGRSRDRTCAGIYGQATGNLRAIYGLRATGATDTTGTPTGTTGTPTGYGHAYGRYGHYRPMASSISTCCHLLLLLSFCFFFIVFVIFLQTAPQLPH